MIITFKNLQQQTFKIEFDPEKTVLELKQTLFNERGADYGIDRQKLIYAGVILEDERTIASYNVDEKKFVVVMLKRMVAAPKPEATTEITASTPAIENQAQAVSKQEAPKGADPCANDNKDEANSSAAADESRETTAPTEDTVSAESHLLMGDAYQQSVESIVEMGYERVLVERAMAASYNNPERAVEYLISGIPESESETAAPSMPEQVNAEQSQAEADPFAFLRDQPQFMQMRSLVYQNPDLLQAVLQQIGQTNPALLQLISENQDAFLNMINQPLDGSSESRSQPSGNANAAGNLGVAIESLSRNLTEQRGSALPTTTQGANVSEQRVIEGDGRREQTTRRAVNQSIPEGVPTIRLTPQDKDAIERLKALGFPEALVLQAYFACEKDEQLAANFLISTGFDD